MENPNDQGVGGALFLMGQGDQTVALELRVDPSFSSPEMLHSPLPCSSGKSTSEGTDVFISYRRSTGSQLAR